MGLRAAERYRAQRRCGTGVRQTERKIELIIQSKHLTWRGTARNTIHADHQVPIDILRCTRSGAKIIFEVVVRNGATARGSDKLRVVKAAEN